MKFPHLALFALLGLWSLGGLSAEAARIRPSAKDIDGDGIPDLVDPDVDNDGIPNGLDSNVDGGRVATGPLRGRFVGDHLNNDAPLERDIDGDGLLDDSLAEKDIDGDGLNDDSALETDIDGDGRADDSYFERDIDGDGRLDDSIREDDIDGDSRDDDDADETDIDGDGLSDSNPNEDDIDGDGLLNTSSLEFDADGDGVPDREDGDEDGDGLFPGPDPDRQADGKRDVFSYQFAIPARDSAGAGTVVAEFSQESAWFRSERLKVHMTGMPAGHYDVVLGNTPVGAIEVREYTVIGSGGDGATSLSGGWLPPDWSTGGDHFEIISVGDLPPPVTYTEGTELFSTISEELGSSHPDAAYLSFDPAGQSISIRKDGVEVYAALAPQPNPKQFSAFEGAPTHGVGAAIGQYTVVSETHTTLSLRVEAVPPGDYDVFVNGTRRGSIRANVALYDSSGLSPWKNGTFLFSTDAADLHTGDALLDFSAAGAQIEIRQGDVTYFTATVPSA